MTANPIFVALDTPDLDEAVRLAQALTGSVGGLKVGLEFITAQGPEGIKRIVALGLPVFVDVKFHDIPNTVAGACRALAGIGAALFNVHAAGGLAMMRAAREAAGDGPSRPKVLAVTVLTSLGETDLAQIGQNGPAEAQVVRLALLAKVAGLDGVVCSPREIGAVRAACGPDFLIVTPGVRPAGSALGDQNRVMTPAEAKAAGADILVIGRPITAAPDPAQAAGAIVAELSGAAALA